MEPKKTKLRKESNMPCYKLYEMNLILVLFLSLQFVNIIKNSIHTIEICLIDIDLLFKIRCDVQIFDYILINSWNHEKKKS